MLGLGEREVQAALPCRAAGSHELKRQRGLANAGITLDQEQPISRQPTAEYLVQSGDPGAGWPGPPAVLHARSFCKAWAEAMRRALIAQRLKWAEAPRDRDFR